MDLVYVSSVGALNKVEGTPAASPKPPALPANSILLAFVSVAAGAVNVQNSNITSRIITVATATTAHAATHLSTGTDGIANATASQNGLESPDNKMFLTTGGTADITGAVTLTFTAVAATLPRRLTGNVSITLAAPVAGWYALALKQDTTGSRTITFTTTVLWSGGTIPTWTTTVSKTDIVSLFYDGTSWFGQSSLNH